MGLVTRFMILKDFIIIKFPTTEITENMFRAFSFGQIMKNHNQL